MNAPTAAELALKMLEDHFKNSRKGREDFDMDDRAEMEHLKLFPRLEHAIEFFLTAEIPSRWRAADGEAKKYQKSHRSLSRVAVATGFGAIMLAVMQMALILSWPNLVPPDAAIGIEGVILLASFVSVSVGLYVKLDHKWLGYRHVAERLRMLKFLSLAHPDLWRDDPSALADWTQWADREFKAIPLMEKRKHIEKWSKEDTSETKLAGGGQIAIMPESQKALILYYRYKRLRFQSDYFHYKGKDAGKNLAVKMRRYREPLFFATILLVIVHIAADLIVKTWHPSSEHVFKLISIWAIALAAMVPVIGMGVRAWSAVFELSRKARCFEAKHIAMMGADKTLCADSQELSDIVAHEI